jgi:methionine-rich copper-binding protein CopC
MSKRLKKFFLIILLLLSLKNFLNPNSARAVEGFGGGESIGIPGGGDTSPPSITSFTPADDAIGVSVSANLSIDFNEVVNCQALNYLSIFLSSNNSLFESIESTSPNISGCNTSSITIDPSSNFANSTSYYVQIDSGTFQDSASNSYAGIADTTSWNFTTEPSGDVTAPTVSSFSPSDGSIGVSISSNFVIEFNENIQKGIGNITIKKSDGSTIETIDVTTAKVTISANSLTINPDATLNNLTDYYILIDSTAVEDLAGNDYAGIASSTAWNFKTAGVSGSGWYYSGQWLKRVKITIDEYQVRNDLSDFPIYVDLSDLSGTDFFDYVKSDGSDIRVTTSSGDTEIPREVVYIDTVNKKGELHFKADGTLSGSANTDFYIYYDNASATEPGEDSTYGSQNVWTNSFAAVWHMAQTPIASVVSIMDSTANNNDGTPDNTWPGPTLTNNSLVGKSISFDGTFVDIPASSSMYPSNISLLTISKADKLYQDNTGNSIANTVFQKGSGTAYDGYLQYVLPEGGTYTSGYSTNAKSRFKVVVGKGSKYDWVTANKAVQSATDWHVIQSSYIDSGSKEFRLYQFGNLDKEELTTGSISATNATSRIAQVPSFLSNDEYFRGQIDEIRYSSVRRSSDWMFSEFVSLSCPHIFYLVNDNRPTGYYSFSLLSRSPLNDAVDVTKSGLVLSLTFNSNVYPNTGNLYLKRYSDDVIIETIDVLGNQVSGTGTSTLSFSINSTLETGVKYYVVYDASLIIDSCGQLTSVLSDKNTWAFTSSAPPTVSSLSPADNDTGISGTANLVMTFSENIVKGTGNIVIKKVSDGSVLETIAVTDASVTVSTNTVTINPSTTLPSGTEVYVEIASTAIKDASDNYYAGINDSTTWNFTTADTTAPTVSSLSPADDSTQVLLSSNLVITFSENIFAGTGNILVKKSSDNSIAQTISVNSPNVTISGAEVTINLASDLLAWTQYYIQIPNTAFTDSSGNAYAGINDTSSWNFTTSTYPEVYATDPPVEDALYNFQEAKVEFTENISLTPGGSNLVCRIGSNSGNVVYTRTLTEASITANPKQLKLPDMTDAFYSAPGYPIFCSIESSAIKSNLTQVENPSDYTFEFTVSPNPILP